MSKTRSSLRCQECGYLSPKWLGKCPGCGSWNSLAEELTTGITEPVLLSPDLLEPITSFERSDTPRFLTGLEEFDRVLGGGYVPGSLVLLGGEPGIGKSTLMLQVGLEISASKKVVLISGEESREQVRMRAERLGRLTDNFYVVTETNLDIALEILKNISPHLVVIDSVQTIFSPSLAAAPGSVGQVRECAGILMRLAKENGMTLLLTGQVTKDGYLAGPRVLEHLVDTVLYFEGDRGATYRILRAVKNRFGATDEIGVFGMGDRGLYSLSDPRLFLPSRDWSASGAAVTASLEGSRPFLVEVQALVAPSYLAAPRRLTSGLDHKRVILNLAVLEQRGGVTLESQDVYVNVAGGVKVNEPAADLPTVLAIISAQKDKAMPESTVVLGELGLTGEIRPVAQIEARLREAERMGFTTAVIPGTADVDRGKVSVDCVLAKTLGEAVDAVGLY